MIERQTIGDRKATVAYFDDDLEMVDKDKASTVKVVFDDGETLWLATLQKETEMIDDPKNGEKPAEEAETEESEAETDEIETEDEDESEEE